MPTEEQQFQTYKLAAEAMGMKKVIIRTADLGGDKQAESLDLSGEGNPMMGYRGSIRKKCLKLSFVLFFVRQLLAILALCFR